MSRGPYKKNDTFDGEVLIDHFKEFLKVYLKPADESVITYKEMLEAIEKTLICFHDKHNVSNRHRIKTLSLSFFFGYAMTQGYKGKSEQIIHSRHCYSYSLQKQLEVSEQRCKFLEGRYTRGHKVAKGLHQQFKKIKRKSPSSLMELLSAGNVVLGPMLSNSFAENQKLKLEDLPSLKESSFDHIF